MAMGTRKQRERQEPLWYQSELPEAPGHPFYQRRDFYDHNYAYASVFIVAYDTSWARCLKEEIAELEQIVKSELSTASIF